MKYRISDVASINESSISKSTYIGSVNYVDTSSVISGNFNGYRHYPSISEAPSRARRLVSKEDTVISTVRPNMKHVGFISSKSDCIYSTGFAVVSPKKDKIDPYYLYLFLSSNRVTEVLQSIGETSTSTYPSVKPSDIGNLVIDMPPLDEQHLIANRIRLIDEKKNQNSQINANLLHQGLLKINYLIEHKKLNKQKINEMDLIVSDHVANGSFKALKQGVSYSDSKNYALFLRNVDLKNDLNNNLRYIDKPSYDFLRKSHLFGGEVVISNVADVGSVHRVPYLNTHMVVGNNQIFLKSKDSRLTDYLYLYFKSRYGQHDIETITSGSAQQKFNKTDFRSLNIPIIDLSIVQKQISPLLKEIDSLKSEIKILNNLKSILLAKYF